MRKTWNKVIIVTWFLIALITAVAVVVLLPYYKTWHLFRTIDKGGWSTIKEEFANLNDTSKEEVLKNLDSYGAFIAKEYTEGKRTFVYTAAAFDAIGLIPERGAEVQTRYMPDIVKNEYIGGVMRMVNLTKTYDVSSANEAQKSIDSASARLAMDQREKILLELLDKSYPSYLNGQMSEDRIKALCNYALNNAFGDAKYRAEQVRGNVDAVIAYRKLYDEAEKYYEEDNYFQVCNICENVMVDPSDKLYDGKFSQLWTRAEIAGKEYYLNELKTYIATGDKINAAALIARLEDYYGDDIDLSKERVEIAEDWQQTYIEVIEQLDVILRNSLSDSEGKMIVSDEDYKKMKPDRMLLLDLENDDVPELILFNSKLVKDDFTPCFFMNFSKKRYGYVGLYNVTYFSSGNEFVYSVVGGDTEETILYSYKNGSVSQVAMAVKEGDKYTVNDAETTDVDYLAERDEIINKASETGRYFESAADIKDCESYVLSYGLEETQAQNSEEDTEE